MAYTDDVNGCPGVLPLHHAIDSGVDDAEVMGGRDRGGVGYSLETYIEASKLNAFRTSLPLPEEMGKISGD